MTDHGEATSASISATVIPVPLEVPLFFLVWVATGVLAAWLLVRRGHDARSSIALGLGLGPLMSVVTCDALSRRDREARSVVFEPGCFHGGPLNVLVLVQGTPPDVVALRPVLDDLAAAVGTLTVGRAVPYEWLDGDLENHETAAILEILADAASRISFRGPRLELFPGTVECVAQTFRERHGNRLVLFAIDEQQVAAHLTSQR